MSDQKICIAKAKLAEQAERYDEMVSEMTKVAKIATTELTVEERNLLSVAFKNLIGSRRNSWRILTSLEGKSAGMEVELAKEYRKQVEKELIEICQDVLDVLDNYLLKTATTDEAKVFFLKMKADYFRYRAEFAKEDEQKAVAKESHDAYHEASQLAKNLDSTHPIKLGLALNFSVFHYEIMHNCAQACELAKSAFDDAISDLDTLNDDDRCKDSTLIMQLLRDNLTLWNTDNEENEGDGEKN